MLPTAVELHYCLNVLIPILVQSEKHKLLKYPVPTHF